jgi:sulfur-oxidizing protein SoxZ
MTTRPRVTIPANIKPNEAFEVRTSITHVMETGNRRDKDGALIKRNIITAIVATLDSQTVFTAELHPGTSANPFVAFFLKVSDKALLTVTWTDDAGQSASERVEIVPG